MISSKTLHFERAISEIATRREGKELDEENKSGADAALRHNKMPYHGM